MSDRTDADLDRFGVSVAFWDPASLTVDGLFALIQSSLDGDADAVRPHRED